MHSHQSLKLSERSPLCPWKAELARLKVGQKIGLGYAIALGIAGLGTVTGITIGEYYQRQAWAQRSHAQTEIELLHQLQAGVLQARTHQQQLIPLLADPEGFQYEYDHLQRHMEQLRILWPQLQKFVGEGEHNNEVHHQEMPEFLTTYTGVPDTYLQTLEQLIQQLEPLAIESPAQLTAAQQRLLAFTNSEVALKFDGISDDLVDLIAASYQENQSAGLAEQQANVMRLAVIGISMALSVAIAVLFARLTSRMITQPLQAVTTVAQEVTQSSDLEMRVPVTTEDEVGIVAVSLNQMIERVQQLLAEQQTATAQQLIQSEKMSSLGRMVAGVAHEINNPVNFIYGNLVHASEYVNDLFELIRTYEAEITNPPEAIADKAEEIDREFLETDLPKLLQSMKTGAERARQIVLSLRNFSRLDEATAHPVDLHDCLESTLLILNNRIKKGITIERHYVTLPTIEGYASSLYQVFMNIFSNAIDVLDEDEKTSETSAESSPFTPTITITTDVLNASEVRVRIADNGSGMPADVMAKIFDPFFTTKPTGVGTGLGLSISRQIVEDKHHGQLTCQSTPETGTEFTIILPVQHPSASKLMPEAIARTAASS